MLISLNWLKKFTQINVSPQELAKIIGSKMVEVESATALGPKYDGVVVARVMSADKIDGSDHLSLCKIDDGGRNQTLERDENGQIQVVCGASNVRANTNIAWIMPGTVVPVTFGTDDELRLDSRKLMGYVSNGMIASPRELALYDEHAGILILDDDITPGTDFAKAYELDDYLFDIENKSLTQRPDCFGIIGFAREVAVILGQEFKSPSWLIGEPQFALAENLKTFIADDNISNKYQLAEINDLQSLRGLSLLEKTYLARVGVRPISPIVDVTNYLMMLSGQPLHAFDYDKVNDICQKQGLRQLEVGVRLAEPGEKLAILDGRELKLSNNDIVISAGTEAIGLAGAMGGKSTEIDESTKRVLLESANFNLYKLRGTQMRHGIFSEAITRFTKGQPAALTAPVLAQAIHQLTGGEARVATSEGASRVNQAITVSHDWANAVLGTNLTQAEMVRSLNNAEFEVESAGDDLLVTAPFWRTDVFTPIEVVEEIGRVYGYDNIRPILPSRQSVAVEVGPIDQFMAKTRKLLVRAGANEALTYSFVNEKLVTKAMQDPKNSYKITNSLSPDLEIYRQSLQPSLLNLIHLNIKAGFDEFAMFEINRVHQKDDGLTDEKVPVERQKLGLIVAKKQSREAAYYLARKYLDFLVDGLGLTVELRTVDKFTTPDSVMFEPKRSAEIIIANQVVGVAGEYKTSVKNNFKLPDFVAGFEIDMVKIFDAYRSGSEVMVISLNKFPSVSRSICFESETSAVFADLASALQDTIQGSDLCINSSLVDIFVTVDRKKRTTFDLEISSPAKTLTGEEVASLMDSIADSVSKKLKVTVI